MSKPEETTHLIVEVEDAFVQLAEKLKGTPVSRAVRNQFENIRKTIDSKGTITARNGIADYASTLGSFALHLGVLLDKVDTTGEAKALVVRLRTQAAKLKNNAEADSYAPLGLARIAPKPTPHSGNSDAAAVREELDRHAVLLKKDLAETQSKTQQVAQTIEGLASSVKEELDRLSALHEQAATEIEERKVQADEALGYISAKSIAGSYESSAGIEAKAANWLRGVSLASMAMIVGIVGYTFIESAQGAFDWRTAALRLGMAFILSVPAGYLARESAKHRQQQYRYQQTSLDLRTINPYLASLPEEQQHKLKAEVAHRIFGERREADPISDVGIPNANEIILELIKRLDHARKQ